MKKTLRFLFVALMAMIGMNVSAAEVTDELTWDKLLEGGKGNGYQDFSGMTVTSNAVYAGNASSGVDQYIQLRTNNNNAGIITTTSGGKLKSVTITFHATTNTSRAIEIYGKNEAYTAATELYNADTKGTLLKTINFTDDDKTLTVEGDYTFVGLKSASGAIYVDKIEITWEASGTQGPTKTATTISFADGYVTRCTPGKDETVALPVATVMAGDNAVEGATVTWVSSNENIAPIVNGAIKPVNGTQGEVTITASYAGNDDYHASSKSYKLKLYKGYITLEALVEDLNSTNEKWDNGGELASFWMGEMVSEEFTPVEMLVTYVSGSYNYVTDGTNHLLFYGNATVFGNESQKLKAGDKITLDYGQEQGFDAIWGKAYRYNKLPEFSIEKMVVRVVSENNQVDYTTIAASDLADNLNKPVKIENAEFVSANNKTLTFKVGENSFTVYNNFNLDVTTLEAGTSYVLTGMGSVYKDTFQLYLISFNNVASSISNVTGNNRFQGAIYNLRGQRITTPGKGLYIQNNKKIVVR
jgi:hypothetical protein